MSYKLWQKLKWKKIWKMNKKIKEKKTKQPPEEIKHRVEIIKQ